MYPPRSVHETFLIGFAKNPRCDFDVYARGYFRAAEALVESCLARPSFPDYDAYPIMFLYRQALELGLKACIYNSELLAWIVGEKDLDHRLINDHNLLSLSGRAKSITDRIFPNDRDLNAFMTEVVQAARHIQEIDRDSQAFRYPVRRNGEPVFAESTSFGLEHTTEQMARLHNGLEAIQFGIQVTEEGWIDLYESLRYLE